MSADETRETRERRREALRLLALTGRLTAEEGAELARLEAELGLPPTPRVHPPPVPRVTPPPRRSRRTSRY